MSTECDVSIGSTMMVSSAARDPCFPSAALLLLLLLAPLALGLHDQKLLQRHNKNNAICLIRKSK